MLVNISDELYKQIKNIKIYYEEIMCNHKSASHYCFNGVRSREDLFDDDDSIIGAHMEFIDKLINSIMSNNFDTPQMKFEWSGTNYLAFTDEVGGFHCDGTGTNPLGEECGECSNLSCINCSNRFYNHYKEK